MSNLNFIRTDVCHCLKKVPLGLTRRYSFKVIIFAKLIRTNKIGTSSLNDNFF